MFVDNRTENALICAPRALDDSTRVNFIVHRQITRDCSGGPKFVRPNDSFVDTGVRDIARIFVHRTACFQSSTALLRDQEKRLPPVPLQTVALEPEQQVGLAVAATGLLLAQPCSNAADSARPRGKNLGSKGIQVDIEHCRRRQYIHRASEIQLLGIAQRAFDTVGN